MPFNWQVICIIVPNSAKFRTLGNLKSEQLFDERKNVIYV